MGAKPTATLQPFASGSARVRMSMALNPIKTTSQELRHMAEGKAQLEIQYCVS
jgi:hypothetical protein